MIITIDTNIIFQALRSANGASYKMLQKVRRGEITMALSNPVLKEYEDVLTRETSLSDFQLSKNEIQSILRLIAFVSEKFEPTFLFRPNLKDEDDNIFVELAVVSQSRYLVTRNFKDYKNSELKFNSFEVVTPHEFFNQRGI